MRTFVDEISYSETKCRQHLARAKLALILGRTAASNEVSSHADLVELAIGHGDQTVARVDEALTKSLFLDLKVNFELFVWCMCRAWIRCDFVESMRRLSRARTKSPIIKDFLKNKSFTDAFDRDGEAFLPAHNLDLLITLLGAFADGVVEIEPQVAVAFAVRHVVEHRNNRIDEKFIGVCQRMWKSTTWADVELRVGAKVPVRFADFTGTYDAMDAATQALSQRMRDAWASMAAQSI